MKHTLPSLPYGYDALEPYIDGRTMELHHAKHHQAYIDKLNATLEKYPAIANQPLDELLRNLDKLPVEAADRNLIRNHGGGHANHSLFWQIMGPKKEADKKLTADITVTFGSVEEFKKQFAQAALTLFGSGWAWLTRDAGGKLNILALPNQDSPLTLGQTPILALDVWEHAYYLKYQNRRAEYIEHWWQVLKLI